MLTPTLPPAKRARYRHIVNLLYLLSQPILSIGYRCLAQYKLLGRKIICDFVQIRRHQ